MMEVAQKIAKALTVAVGAKGVNIHMNNGEAADQEISHAHLHVVPRYQRHEVYLTPNKEAFVEGEGRAYAEKIRAAL